MRRFAVLTKSRGVTLIEACIALAIVGILAGTALPSFQESNHKRRFEAAVSETVTEVHLARSSAVATGKGVWLSYTPVTGGSCAMIHIGAKADCACGDGARPVCTNGAEALKATQHTVPVSVAAPVLFNPDNGTVTPTATIRVELAPGKQVHHKVNILGRVKSCSPERAVKGFAAC